MKKIFENKIFVIASLFLIFGAVTVIASTIGDSGFSGIQVDNYFAGSGKAGITQNISFEDANRNNHFLEFEDGLLVNYGTGESGFPTEGLISYYKFEEISGTIIDSVGTYNGTNNYVSLYTNGKIENASDFERFSNNNGSYVAFPNFVRPKNITVSAWIKPESFETSNPYGGAFYVSGHDSNAGNLESSFHLNDKNNGGEVQAAVFVSGTRYSADSGSIKLLVDEWYHLAMTYDGEVLKLYINGTEISSNSGMSGGIDAGTGIAFGTPSDEKHVDWFFDGKMDEVGIWDRSLTSEEIALLYNNGSGLTY